MSEWAPDRGDIIRVDLKPVKGHEHGGRTRPVLVLSPYEYNVRTNLCITVPFTTKQKGYPFEVETDTFPMKTRGVILADAVRSIDWNTRNARFIEKADMAFVDDVLLKLATLLATDR
ncbi:MAG: Growth inhibitor [Synergistales bacterium 53_16]|nr:MAG: Growth inhibitor [Synergistales bacterium 53_16]